MIQIALTLLVAGFGGYLFSLAHVPLAWTIGAMVASAMLTWIRPVTLPRLTRPASMVVLGTSFGLGFTAPVVEALLSALPTIVASSTLTVLCGLLLTPLFSRLSGIAKKTSFFCAVPGGIAVMPVLAERANAEIEPVIYSQTLRMVMVVLTIPPILTISVRAQSDSLFHPDVLPVDWTNLGLLSCICLSGALVMSRLNAANPWLIGPLLCSMTITAFWQPPTGFPHWMTNMAQIGMGAGLGVRLTREYLSRSRRVALATFASTGVLIALLTIAAIGIARFSHLPTEAVILGLSPGGTPEMVVTAATLHVSVPLVLSFHIVRMLINNLLVGPLWQLVDRTRFFTD